MSKTPDPARIGEYQARLTELVRARDAYKAERNLQRVKVLNRQIRSQQKWIERAAAAQPTRSR